MTTAKRKPAHRVAHTVTHHAKAPTIVHTSIHHGLGIATHTLSDGTTHTVAAASILAAKSIGGGGGPGGGPV